MITDMQREAVLTVFLAWLDTEENIDLIKNEGKYRRGVYAREYEELIRKYCEWRYKNQSSS